MTNSGYNTPDRKSSPVNKEPHVKIRMTGCIVDVPRFDDNN